MAKITFITVSAAFMVALASAFTQPTTGPAGNPVTNPSAPTEIPGGQAFDFTWKPTTTGSVTIVLYAGPATNLQVIGALAEKVPNSGKYTWNVPATLPATTGNAGYGLQIIDDATGQFQWSAAFGIEQQGGGGGSYTNTDSPVYPTDTAAADTTCTETGTLTSTITATVTLTLPCSEEDTVPTGAEYTETGEVPSYSTETGGGYFPSYPSQPVVTGGEYTATGEVPCPTEVPETEVPETPCPTEVPETEVPEAPCPTEVPETDETPCPTEPAPVPVNTLGYTTVTLETSIYPVPTGGSNPGCSYTYGNGTSCNENSGNGNGTNPVGPVPTFASEASYNRPLALAVSVVAIVLGFVAL